MGTSHLSALGDSLFYGCSANLSFFNTFLLSTITGTIPSTTFAGCTANGLSFSNTFWDSQITAIPPDLFATQRTAGTTISSFDGTFKQMITLTSSVPDLWNIWPSASHSMTFFQDTNAANYASIPSAWK